MVLSELRERVMHESAVIKWTVATFLSGVLNYLILYRITIAVSHVLSGPPPSTDQMILELIVIGLGVGLLLSAFLIPLFCSALASQLLPEKRLVAPVDITFVTIGLLGFQLHLENWPMPQTALGAVASLILLLCGMSDELIARSLVGRGKRLTHHYTVKVHAPIHDVDIALNAQDVRRAFGYDKRDTHQNGNLIVYSLVAVGFRFYMVLAANPGGSTMVHVEEYDVSRYVIEGSQVGKRAFDRDVQDLIKYFRSEKAWTVRRATYDETFPFKDEIDAIIFAPAQSKLASLSHLPKRTVAISLAVTALAAAAYFGYVDQKLTPDNFLLAILGVGSLIVGLIPSMEWTHKKE